MQVSMEVSTACKLPYSFYKTLTKTSTEKRSTFLEVPMKDSRVCWEVGMREELELVTRRQEDDKEKLWTVTWRSGRNQQRQRGDRILGGWHPIALHYKLVPKDVLAFTILNPSLVSVLIINRHLHPSSRPYISPLLQLPPLSKVMHATTQRSPGCKNLPTEAESAGFSKLLNRELAYSRPPNLLITNQATEHIGPSQVPGRALWHVKVKAEHLQGGLLLLDIPPKFAGEMAKGCQDQNTKAGLDGEAQPPLIRKLVLGHHEIKEEDLCVFELIITGITSEVAANNPSCSVLQVYVYRKDRGKPSTFNITFTP